MIRRIDLVEYQRAEVDLSDDDVRALAEAAGSGLSISLGTSPGTHVLKADSHVGSITLDDRIEVRIRPKLLIANVLYLLMAPTLPRDWLRDRRVGYGEAPDAVAAFATLYARTLSDVLARGPHRDYREQEEDLVALRGRVDIARQLRRPGQVSPIASRYVDFTVDVDRNRYVKHAAGLLLRTPGVPMGARREIRHAVGKLDLVSDRDVPAVDFPDRMVHTRLTEPYRPILRLSRMVREARTLSDRAGSVQAAAFLLDMNRVFESFIEHSLRDALRGRYEVVGQHQVHLDIGRRVLMKPDLVLRSLDTGRIVSVADVKYKVSDDERARAPDYYQLLAYTTRLGLDQGTLLYAQLGGVEVGEVVVRHAGTVLRTLPVDVTGSPTDVARSVRTLADALVDQKPESRPSRIA